MDDRGLPPQMSNSDCLPGRAGGTPIGLGRGDSRLVDNAIAATTLDQATGAASWRITHCWRSAAATVFRCRRLILQLPRVILLPCDTAVFSLLTDETSFGTIATQFAALIANQPQPTITTFPSAGEQSQDLTECSMSVTFNTLVETAALAQLQAQCDAAFRLAGDRHGTPTEMDAFLNGLSSLERYCWSLQATAAQFHAAGLPTLAQRLDFVLRDIEGAREVFKQPPSREPGAATRKADELQRRQNEVAEFSGKAMLMVDTDPSSAEPMLHQALKASKLMFDEQRAFLQSMPWGPAHLAKFEKEQLEARSALQAALGEVAIRRADYDAACRWYQAALDALGTAPHPAKGGMMLALARISRLAGQGR